MGTSGSTSMQAMELEKLEMMAKKKALQDRIAGRDSGNNSSGNNNSGGGRMSGGSASGGGGQDQAARDKELAAELAEKARSQQAGSDNRLKEDTNRANLAEKAREDAARRALALASSVR
jgi:hypothetical protein